MTFKDIALNELTATIKRQEIIVKNSADPEEQFIALNIAENLKQIKAQLVEYVKTPQFKAAVEQYTKAKEETKE